MRFCKLTRAQLRKGPLGGPALFLQMEKNSLIGAVAPRSPTTNSAHASPADFFGSLESAQMPPQFLDA
jgi:hypothetical protein